MSGRTSKSRSAPRTKRDREIDAIYAEIPSIPDCTGACATACGPIYMFTREWERATNSLGHVPKGLRSDGMCPMLAHNGKCRVYSVRPYICRLWGCVKEMRCPQGCEPERWLTRDEAHEILKRLQAVAGPEATGPLGPIEDLMDGIGLARRAERAALIEAIRERRAADGERQDIRPRPA